MELNYGFKTTQPTTLVCPHCFHWAHVNYIKSAIKLDIRVRTDQLDHFDEVRDKSNTRVNTSNTFGATLGGLIQIECPICLKPMIICMHPYIGEMIDFARIGMPIIIRYSSDTKFEVLNPMPVSVQREIDTLQVPIKPDSDEKPMHIGAKTASAFHVVSATSIEFEKSFETILDRQRALQALLSAISCITAFGSYCIDGMARGQTLHRIYNLINDFIPYEDDKL